MTDSGAENRINIQANLSEGPENLGAFPSTEGAILRTAIVLILAFLLASCGGGDSATSGGVTSPSVSLVGSYVLTGYDVNGVSQLGHQGTLQIGATEINAQSLSLPVPFEIGRYTYTLGSGSGIKWMQVKDGTLTRYTFNYSTDNTLVLMAWKQINNVMYESYWEKTSNHTTLN